MRQTLHTTKDQGRVPLRRLAVTPIVNGVGEAAEEWSDGDYRYIRTTDIASLDGLHDAKKAGLPMEKGAGAVLRYDDIVMTAAGATIGKAHHWRSHESACYAGFLVRFRADPRKCDSRFIAWWTQSDDYAHQVSAGAVRSTIDNFSAGKYRALRVPLFNLNDQRSKAAYLDSEVPKIDAVIDKQRTLRDSLRLRRASMIEAAVTRGLGFKSSLRTSDSGEVNRVPDGWSLIRADRALQRVKRAPREQDGVVTAFRDGQVTLRTNRRTDGFTEALQEIGYQGIRQGDLVIHAMDAFAGAIGVSDSDGKASPVVHAYRGKLADPHFMAYVLREASRAGYIQSLAKGIRERSTSFDPASLKKVYVFLPGLDEQRKIVAHVASETAKIDVLIACSERLIELSQERRTALITAAVTGQIDISSDTKALDGAA